jgi:predicted transcriptional regulator
MVTIQLDPKREERLRELAAADGQEIGDLARRVLEDYLDFQAWPQDDPADWAAASVALAPQVLREEKWDEAGD